MHSARRLLAMTPAPALLTVIRTALIATAGFPTDRDGMGPVSVSGVAR